MDARAVRALLSLAVQTTDARSATLCVCGRGMRWRRDRPRDEAPETVSCRPDRCAGPHPSSMSRIALPLDTGEAGVAASLCLAGAQAAEPAKLEALAAEASAQLRLHLKLAQEATLAGEADHRIKNALQSVASYLRLQEGRTHERDAKDALAAAGRHVRAIALMHDEIGRAGGGGHVRLDHTMKRIAQLFQAVTPEPVRIALDVAPAVVPRETATLLAVIANEFVTNAAKHAGSPTGHATVRITARYAPPADGPGACHPSACGDARSAGATARGEPGPVLEVAMEDDGPGLTPSTDGGLGLRIMETAAAKLGTSAAIVTGPQGGCRLALAIEAAPVHTAGACAPQASRAESPEPTA